MISFSQKMATGRIKALATFAKSLHYHPVHAKLTLYMKDTKNRFFANMNVNVNTRNVTPPSAGLYK